MTLSPPAKLDTSVLLPLQSREMEERPLSERIPGLRRYLAALYGVRASLRALPGADGAQAVRRTSLDGRVLFLPETYRGFRDETADRLYLAATAHAGAHLAFGGARFEPKSLKPLQIALVSLLEDARVEWLAMEALPGLRRLWRPFHEELALDKDGATATAEVLLARLSLALFDPARPLDNPWLAKGRDMFFAAMPEWDDPGALRLLGSLLGNDLGQMRVQFNAKTYAVQPVYRDDNAGLWEFDRPPPPEEEDASLAEAVRIETREKPPEPGERERQEAGEESDPRPASLSPLDPDQWIAVARMPEWDHGAGRLRPDWTTIVEATPRTAPAGLVERWLEARPDIARRTAGLIRQAKVGRPARLRRQGEGDRLDLDAAVRAAIDLRAGFDPDTRIFERSALSERDLAMLVLLDISESTKDTIGGTATSVFSVLREAVAHLSAALAETGDRFALHAFCSNGRDEVRYRRVKEFTEPFGNAARSRLAGLRPGLSTRMGAALRVATREAARQLSHRRLVLVVTDGEPSDIDVTDPAYLVEDARKAVQEAASAGVDVFCVGLDKTGETYLSRIFGRGNFVQIGKVEMLPDRLPQIYVRLTR
ncbi:nitric oxide reductase activation protein NorD [Stappia sp.]|uniref:nitric oxide reductase activation protein NorD n=1 Tax=Stappia sp. TaxID=1870903 RepID=UPI003D0A7764